MDYKLIGSYIRMLRKEKGLTLKELADKLSVSFQAVSKWEVGECLPDTSLLLDLCDILGTSVDKLLGGGVYLRNERKLISAENIVTGFGYLAKAKDCFGAQSDFYKGMVSGISERMNFDFEDALVNHREVLYAEAIIHLLAEGYRVDLEEVKQYIHTDHLIREIAKRL